MSIHHHLKVKIAFLILCFTLLFHSASSAQEVNNKDILTICSLKDSNLQRCQEAALELQAFFLNSSYTSFSQQLIQHFSEFDKNNDSRVCRYENMLKLKFTYTISQVIQIFDLNKDNCLDMSELVQSRKIDKELFVYGLLKSWFKYDTNYDLVLEEGEIYNTVMLKRYVAQIDDNKDLKISPKELINFYNAQALKLFEK